MSTPVVVQGVPVANPHMVTTYPPQQPQAPTTYHEREGKQQTKCNDSVFAILFYICVICIVAVAIVYGPDALNTAQANAADGGGETFDYNGFMIAAAIIVVISFAAAGVALAIMMAIPETLIKISLIFVVIMAFLWMIMTLMGGNVLMGMLGLLMFGITLCYARAVWPRIPFATANLVTSITAIRKNLGVAFFAYLFTAIGGVWSMVWALAFTGIFNKTYSCDANNECSGPNYFFVFLLLVSFYFVQQVLQNCVHTTVAGTVGHWWFEPSEASHCCSTAVMGAFIRTVTTSFGSICFGSLLVAILEALKTMARMAREQDDGNGILLCLAECILGCLASMMEYFNKWAFIYVGLYGFPYLEAGKNVMQLFHNRGWEAIIVDNLVDNTLMLMSLVTGGVMGGIAVLIETSSDLFENAGGNSKGTAFLLGFVIGMAITSILLSTVGSGVNAVVVLFAEAPADFQRNHPVLSERMRHVWSQVYPGSV